MLNPIRIIALFFAILTFRLPKARKRVVNYVTGNSGLSIACQLVELLRIQGLTPDGVALRVVVDDDG